LTASRAAHGAPATSALEHARDRLESIPPTPLPKTPARTDRGLTAINGAIALIAIVVITQMWLLAAALDALLAGLRDTAAPAAIASGLLFAMCAGLYVFIEGVDRRQRP